MPEFICLDEAGREPIQVEQIVRVDGLFLRFTNGDSMALTEEQLMAFLWNLSQGNSANVLLVYRQHMENLAKTARWRDLVENLAKAAGANLAKSCPTREARQRANTHRTYEEWWKANGGRLLTEADIKVDEWLWQGENNAGHGAYPKNQTAQWFYQGFEQACVELDGVSGEEVPF